MLTSQVCGSIVESPNKGHLWVWSSDVNCREIQIPDVAGKTIRSMRILVDKGVESEVEINFTYGTTFSSSTRQRVDVSAKLYIGGTGEPEVLKTYTDE